VLVPGVRASGGAVQDQARVVTPREAASAGATYVIVGRMVTAAPDRRAAMDAVLEELRAPKSLASSVQR
jgi:orotidine-5'-phosphate decarboxylase